MNIKEYLQKQVDNKKNEIREAEQRKTELEKRSDASNDFEELKRINVEARSLGETLTKLKDELQDAENQLASVDEPAPDQTGARKFKPLSTIKRMEGGAGDEDKFSSTEYRKAFRDYLVTGKMPEEYRATTTKTSDANVSSVIPTNLVNRILEKFEQLGVIYNLVTKTSYPVGQTIPVDGVKPVATWVGEGAGSVSQNKTLNASITFTHFKLRCEVRYTEEIATMALDAFENLFVKQVSEAMLRAQEAAIVDGNGTSQPTGILTYTAPEGQALTLDKATPKLTYKLLCDAEAAIPVEYEATAKWCMTKKTFMAFVGMTDSAGQPIARVNYGINGKPERTLLGRDVVIYAPQTGSKLGSYTATAPAADTLIAFIVDFGDYVLNENYNLGIQHAIDWDNEDHKTKAVLACDGKLIRTDSLVTLTETKTGE